MRKTKLSFILLFVSLAIVSMFFACNCNKKPDTPKMPIITVSGETQYQEGAELSLLIEAVDSDGNVLEPTVVYPQGMFGENGKLVKGEYVIICYAEDSDGNRAEKEISISVRAKQYLNYSPSIDELLAGFTFNWEDNFMTITNGKREKIEDISNADAKSAIISAQQGFSSGAVMHLTGPDTHNVDGFTRSAGNLLQGYVYTFEIWYYDVSSPQDYVIALGDGNNNRTFLNGPFTSGLNKLTFEYEASSGIEYALTFYGANGNAMDVYLGEFKITARIAAVARNDYHAVSDEEMLAEGGYTYDWSENNIIKILNNAKYLVLDDIEDEELKSSLINTGAFSNGYALRFTGTSGSYIDCLSGKLVAGATYTVKFTAFEKNRGSTCILLMSSGNQQVDRANWSIMDGADGTVVYSLTFKPSSSAYHVSFYIINKCELYIADFNLAMTLPIEDESLQDIVIERSFSADDIAGYGQYGYLISTPTAVSGADGFGEYSFKIEPVENNGVYVKSFPLVKLKEYTVNDPYYKEITITINYYVESVSGNGLFMQLGTTSFSQLTGISVGLHQASASFNVGINELSLYYQDGQFGTIYIGSIDISVSTKKDVAAIERKDFGFIDYTELVSDDGYVFDFTENKALKLSGNFIYKNISEMPNGEIKTALTESGAFESGTALFVSGVGSTYIDSLCYNVIPDYSYTVSFKAYVIKGTPLLLLMGGQQNAALNFAQSSSETTGITTFTVSFIPEVSDFRINLFLRGQTEMYLSEFTVKAVAPENAPAPIIFTENDFYSSDNCQLVPNGYAGGNSIWVKSASSDGEFLTSTVLDAFNSGDRVHVSFRLNLSGVLGRDKSDLYSTVKIYDGYGQLVDSAYPVNGWIFVNFDSPVVVKDGVKYVRIKFDALPEGGAYISDFRVDDDITDIENIFGGTKLTMLKNDGISQMQGLLISSSDGKLIVVDGGTSAEKDRLINAIKANATDIQAGKYVVNAWFITHYHSDHIGALISLLRNSDEIYIEQLWFDFSGAGPENNDNDTGLVQELNNALQANSHKVGVIRTPNKGDEVIFGTIKVKVLNDAYFGSSSNVVNNSSVVYKVETEGESILILGDLGNYGDTLLDDEYFRAEIATCSVIQVSHHGQNGVSDAFYKAINKIKIALYCAPDWLYNVYETAGQTSGEIGAGTYGTLWTRGLMRELGVRYSFALKNDNVVLG